ncbi:MAG: alpha-glucuronidase family glycosyl hydrolase, partial [Cellvibrio sp.]|uniref:alpha-glucuronidase family glycosyl hydrolase n=1 Tax=Cellvibrio sp. TaxID=1965322 RepID=UPI0031A55C6C
MRRIFLYKIFILLTLVLGLSSPVRAEDGYEMWLRYQPLVDQKLRKSYQQQLGNIVVEGNSPSLQVAVTELQRGLGGLLAKPFAISKTLSTDALLVGTPANSPLIASLHLNERLSLLGAEGYLIESTKVNKRNVTIIAANSDIGVLYGSFHLLRLIQTQQSLDKISIASAPKLQHRVINHWDN